MTDSVNFNMLNILVYTYDLYIYHLQIDYSYYHTLATVYSFHSMQYHLCYLISLAEFRLSYEYIRNLSLCINSPFSNTHIYNICLKIGLELQYNHSRKETFLMATKRVSKEIGPSNLAYNPSAYPDGVAKLSREEMKKDLKQVILHIEDKTDLSDDTPHTYERDISSTLIYNLFGDFGPNNGPLCHPYDTITIPPGVYGPSNKKNKNSFVTTVGLWIYNRWYIERDLFNVFGYINESITKKMFNKINDKLSYALLEDKITVDQLKGYLEKTQKIMPFETILAPNMDEDLLTVTKKLNVASKKLFADNKEALDKGDPAVAEKVLGELLDYAKELLKDDPGMDNYLSGSGASMENFSNFFIAKGIIYDSATNEFRMMRSNYLDGISAEDYVDNAASLSVGPYFRAKRTADGGYYSKLILSAYQHIKIGPRGSDCGTSRTVKVTLTPSNAKWWIYSYVKEGNRLVELTSDNIDKYIGKTVNMRFSALCESKEHICEHCAGTMFNRLGVTNVGMGCNQIAERLKAAMLKQFHSSAISTSEIDPSEAFNVR